MNRQRQKPQRVLIVDDDPRLVSTVDEVLNDAGYETRTAGDGHAAIQRLSTFVPDVIVLDLMMPHMTGFEVLDWLKQNDLHVPVVVATTEDDWKVPASAAIVRLTKPFTLEQLLEGVAVALKASPPKEDKA